MPEIQRVIEHYIAYCQSELTFTEQSLNRYRFILSVYQEFLLTQVELNDTTIYPYLKGLTFKEILASLDYYIKEYPVKAEDTALFYVSVIKEFLRYLVQCRIIENSNIIESFGRSDKDKDAFNYHCIEHMKLLIQQGTIKESRDGTPLNEEQIEKVIEYCNRVLSVLEMSDADIGQENYNRCINALITKIVIYTGV